jgi:hypothetical protein
MALEVSSRQSLKIFSTSPSLTLSMYSTIALEVSSRQRLEIFSTSPNGTK